MALPVYHRRYDAGAIMANQNLGAVGDPSWPGYPIAYQAHFIGQPATIPVPVRTVVLAQQAVAHAVVGEGGGLWFLHQQGEDECEFSH